MKLNFWKKDEKRNVNVVVETLGNTEASAAALSLLFGNGITKYNSMSLSAVYRAVNLISESFSSLPCILYKLSKNDEPKEYETHPMYDLLYYKPTKLMTAFQWKKAMMEDLLLKGNAYSQIIRDDENRVVELRYIPAGRVTVNKIFNADNDVIDVQYGVSGKKRMLTSDEMIHVKGMCMDEDKVEGKSVLFYAQNALNLAKHNEDAANGYFTNGGRLSGIIKVQSALTQKQKTDMQDAWRRTFGTGGEGGIAVLSGAQDYQSVQMNASDAQLLESRQFEITTVARFFGISPILLYDLAHANYSSAEQAHLALLTDTLSYYINAFESEIENKCFLPYERKHIDVRFDTTSFLRMDQKTKAEFYRTLWNFGVVSINEVRAAFDMDPVEDGDNHYIQAQMVTLQNAKNLGANKLDSTLEPENNTEQNEKDENPVDSSVS